MIAGMVKHLMFGDESRLCRGLTRFWLEFDEVLGRRLALSRIRISSLV
jgi:hypothetical protein